MRTRSNSIDAHRFAFHVAKRPKSSVIGLIGSDESIRLISGPLVRLGSNDLEHALPRHCIKSRCQGSGTEVYVTRCSSYCDRLCRIKEDQLWLEALLLEVAILNREEDRT